MGIAFILKTMKTLRGVLGVLAIIPIALLVNHILIYANYYGEDSLREMIYIVMGIPILVLNLWASGYPSIVQFR
jgi:hypothetical protein